MIRIIHASDFHFNGSFFKEELWNEFQKKAKALSPDILILTGDITDFGYMEEYICAKRYIDSLGLKTIVVPGNHDSRNVGYLVFEKFFGPRWKVWENNNLTILCGDSSEPDIDDGHIGRENYEVIKNAFFKKDTFKIFAIHHHLLPVPNTGRERNIPVDAGDVLDLIINSKVNLVLSGHKHVGWRWKLENTEFIVSGTATTLRIKNNNPPCFFCIDIEPDKKTYSVNKIPIYPPT